LRAVCFIFSHAIALDYFHCTVKIDAEMVVKKKKAVNTSEHMAVKLSECDHVVSDINSLVLITWI
jgi:hypothetical protein